MAAKPLRNSSGNVYKSHWKTFTLWANNKGFLPSDISYVTPAAYLVYLFSQHKKMNTIQVHKASISSVLKILNPPTALPEETLHNVIRRMTILRPREQDVLPNCHLSVVLLEILSYKTAFWLSWLLVLEDQNLSSYPEPRTTWNLPLWLQGLNRHLPVWSPSSSLNQRPEIIPEPIRFPGMAHLFPDEPERLLCPVRVLGLYLSGRLIVHKKILRRSFLCTSTLQLRCF